MRLDLAKWLERLTANAEVATVLGSIPASSGTVESERRQMKQCWIQYIEKKIPKKSPVKIIVRYSDLALLTCIILQHMNTNKKGAGSWFETLVWKF